MKVIGLFLILTVSLISAGPTREKRYYGGSGGQNYPSGGQRYLPGGQGYTTGGLGYPTGGQGYPTGGQGYPTGGHRYPTGGQGYPTGGQEYPNPPWPNAQHPGPRSHGGHHGQEGFHQVVLGCSKANKFKQLCTSFLPIRDSVGRR